MTITPLLRRSLPLACLGLSLPACAQVNADVRASIRLLQTLTTRVDRHLELGRLSLPANRTGETTLVLAAGGSAWTMPLPSGVQSITPPAHAQVTFFGAPGQTIQITVPAPFQLSSGAHRLTFTPTLSASPVILHATTGAGEVTLGGTLTIPAAAGLGLDYTGTFQCTANYQ